MTGDGWRLILAFIVSILAWQDVFAGEVLLKRGDSFAQGVTHPSGTLCYVVTAAHVVAPGDQTIVISASGEHYSTDLVHSSSLDLAILLILAPRGQPTPCQDDNIGALTTLQDIDVLLNGAEAAYLRALTESGTIRQIPLDVLLVGRSRLSVRPRSHAVTVQQGLSGSGVYVANALVGFLVSVDGEGSAEVVRVDHAKSSLESFLGWSNPCMPPCEFTFGQLKRVARYRLGESGLEEWVYRIPANVPAPPFLHLVSKSGGLPWKRPLPPMPERFFLSYGTGPMGVSTVEPNPLSLDAIIGLVNVLPYESHGERMFFELIFAEPWVVRFTPYDLASWRWQEYWRQSNENPEELQRQELAWSDPTDPVRLWIQWKKLSRNLERHLSDVEEKAHNLGKFKSDCRHGSDLTACSSSAALEEEMAVLLSRAEDLRAERNWVQQLISALIAVDTVGREPEPAPSIEGTRQEFRNEGAGDHLLPLPP